MGDVVMRRLVVLAVLCALSAGITAAPAQPRLACAQHPARCAQALRWQRADRARLRRENHTLRTHLKRVHAPTIREAAFLAGRAFGIDPWSLLRLGRCESHLDPYAVNPTSGATGWLQFLSGTWASTPFAAFPRTNAYAEALAAAQIIRSDGGTRQWACPG